MEEKELENFEDQNPEALIESYLFYKGSEISFSELSKKMGFLARDIENFCKILVEKYEEDEKSSLNLVLTENSATLSLKKDFLKILDNANQEEISGELSKPALETLSIILYKSPISRFEIDSVRGVNSTYILRNLSIRGLISIQKKDGKIFYVPTTDLYRFLGISKKDELPDYEKFLKKIEMIEKGDEENLEKSDQNKDEKNNEN